jgi:hypothetical protein
MGNPRQRKKKREAKAAELAKAAAANGAQAAQAKAVAPCPKAAAAKAEAERIEKKYDDISKNGHAVQRHGEAITEQQLKDRAVKGFDPVTGTTNDAYNKFPNGTPKKHNYGRHATKFNSKEALVKADEKIRSSDAFKKKVADANASNAKVIAVTDTKLKDVFGDDYKKQVTGKTREGSKNNPTGNTTNTDFTDGTIRAVYKKDAKGNWNVETMFPEPKS